MRYLFLVALAAAGMPAQSAAELAKQPVLSRALELVRQTENQTIEEQIRLSQIPAPTGEEKQRAQAVLAAFRQAGLQNTRIDGAGNVIGERPGGALRPNVLLTAHLDTVFPRSTNVNVRREGSVLHGPGIADDARGLAVILAVARALNGAGVRTRGSVTFAATVGEEGLGNLKGVRHLFDVSLKDKVNAFISVDGSGLSVTHGSVGSRRHRVVFRGRGGHSWGSFGMPNPVYGLARAVSAISLIKLPAEPKTSYNVGRIGGGTSVNSIPHSAWMELDLRSVSAKTLDELEERVKTIIRQAAELEQVEVEVTEVGNRPAGLIQPSAPIVRAAIEATEEIGERASLRTGSTDANYPMSLGIPAIALGGGGSASGAHSPGERFDTTNSYKGTQRALLVTVALAGGLQ